MADASLFIGWGQVVSGREKRSLQVFDRAVALEPVASVGRGSWKPPVARSNPGTDSFGKQQRRAKGTQ